jgi:hypothetical protein
MVPVAQVAGQLQSRVQKSQGSCQIPPGGSDGAQVFQGQLFGKGVVGYPGTSQFLFKELLGPLRLAGGEETQAQVAQDIGFLRGVPEGLGQGQGFFEMADGTGDMVLVEGQNTKVGQGHYFG